MENDLQNMYAAPFIVNAKLQGSHREKVSLERPDFVTRMFNTLIRLFK